MSFSQEPTLGPLPGFRPQTEIIEADAHADLTKGAVVALDRLSTTTIVSSEGVSTTFPTPGGDTKAVVATDRYFAVALDDTAIGTRGRFLFKGRVLVQATATFTAGDEASIDVADLFLTDAPSDAEHKEVAMVITAGTFIASANDLVDVIFDGEGLPLTVVSTEL